MRHIHIHDTYKHLYIILYTIIGYNIMKTDYCLTLSKEVYNKKPLTNSK